MQSLPRHLLMTAGLCLAWTGLVSMSMAAEPDPPTTADQEEIIERVLDLRQQIEDLLEILPEEVRQELEERWRQRQIEEPAPGAEPAAEATPQRESAGEAMTVPRPEPEVETRVEPVATEEEELTAETDELATEMAPPCGGFHLFDTNEDLLVSGGDRQWRFLRLWFDGNSDGRLDESEIESLFDLGVRHIDIALRSYGNQDAESEDVDVGDLVWLRQVGKGSSKRRSGALVVDAGRLASDGHLWLVDADGTQLSGYQPLSSTTILDTREGRRWPLICDAPR